jgi:hypothetical protein
VKKAALGSREGREGKKRAKGLRFDTLSPNGFGLI